MKKVSYRILCLACTVISFSSEYLKNITPKKLKFLCDSLLLFLLILSLSRLVIVIQVLSANISDRIFLSSFRPILVSICNGYHFND